MPVCCDLPCPKTAEVPRGDSHVGATPLGSSLVPPPCAFSPLPSHTGKWHLCRCGFTSLAEGLRQGKLLLNNDEAQSDSGTLHSGTTPRRRAKYRVVCSRTRAKRGHLKTRVCHVEIQKSCRSSGESVGCWILRFARTSLLVSPLSVQTCAFRTITSTPTPSIKGGNPT